MCGIAGAISLSGNAINDLLHNLNHFNTMLEHRGPDGFGVWMNNDRSVGLSHRRLSIIDIENGKQPMRWHDGSCITFNGEVYNYPEIKRELGFGNFSTDSDTEVILASYEKWGYDCVDHFRGMFSFSIWDEKRRSLFCARDPAGIKPFYYAISKDVFYFASEMKALLPFVGGARTNKKALSEYLNFQLTLGKETLFENIYELKPGCALTINNGNLSIRSYWDINYSHNDEFNESLLKRELSERLEDSVRIHTRSDVPIGSYLSGGVDSSSICAIASKYNDNIMAFTGKFSEGRLYDESKYAKMVAKKSNIELDILNINSKDFEDKISKTIYHLDTPVAGPGSFSQFVISERASKHRKVLLGGQGGDEIFGGYSRYMVAYLDQCISGSIEGRLGNPEFNIDFKSIISSLKSLENYKPLLKKLWKKGMFDPIDSRYFRIIERSSSLSSKINPECINLKETYDSFRSIFYGNDSCNNSYLNLMMHFDFKTLLPALLHVEDRVSMAHGIESRVPLLDRSYIDFVASIPVEAKMKNGNMKHIFKESMSKYLPKKVLKRKDKMGFPTPLMIWANGDLKEFICDTLSSKAASDRNIINNLDVVKSIHKDGEFDRSLWAALSIEIWHKEFHDKKWTI